MNAPSVGRIAIQMSHETHQTFWDFDKLELDLVGGVLRCERKGLHDSCLLADVTSLSMQLRGGRLVHLITPS